AHEVITSIMLNAIVAGVALYIGNVALFRGGTTTGAPIIGGAQLPNLGFGGSSASVALVLSIAAVAGMWWLRTRTTIGLASLAFLAQLVRIAVPYALAAMGGSITERSGVIDLALEAKLLFGAFFAAAAAHATGSAYVGVLGGMAAGVAVTAIQLFCTLRLRA